jgi:bacteriocin-like protein
MKNFELSSLTFEDLTEDELNSTIGGIGWLPAGLALALIMSAINNVKDIREGFADGYAGKPRY